VAKISAQTVSIRFRHIPIYKGGGADDQFAFYPWALTHEVSIHFKYKTNIFPRHLQQDAFQKKSWKMLLFLLCVSIRFKPFTKDSFPRMLTL
jgi:hypothetical protein